jgi:HEAT repeat protein
VRTLVLLLPLPLLHVCFGLALRELALRTGAGPRSWAFLPLLNLALLFRVAGRSGSWAASLLLPGVNAAAWALVWADVGRRLGYSGWLGAWMSLPGPNLYWLGRVAGLGARRAAAAATLVAASLAAAWGAHASLQRARVAELAVGLTVADGGDRAEAARQLAALGPGARAAVGALEHASGDPDPAARGQAVRALAIVAPESAGRSLDVPSVLEAARGSAGWALPDAALVRALAGAGPAGLARLEAALHDEDAGVRWHAAAGILRMGARAAASAPALLAAMHDPEWNVRNSAGRALEEVTGPEHSALLAEALVEPDVETRYHVARALARLGRDAAPALPALLETLNDADAEVRMESCWTLAAIGPRARSAGEALLARLGDDDPQVRAAAAWSLAQVGAGSDAAPRLRALSRDPVRDVRDAAADALRRIEARP